MSVVMHRLGAFRRCLDQYKNNLHKPLHLLVANYTSDEESQANFTSQCKDTFTKRVATISAFCIQEAFLRSNRLRRRLCPTTYSGGIQISTRTQLIHPHINPLRSPNLLKSLSPNQLLRNPPFRTHPLTLYYILHKCLHNPQSPDPETLPQHYSLQLDNQESILHPSYKYQAGL